MFERFDWLISQYKRLDDELTVSRYRWEKIEGKVEDHERRISCMEKTLNLEAS